MPKVKPLEKIQVIAKVDEAVVLRIELDRSTLLPLFSKPKGGKAAASLRAAPGIFDDPATLQILGVTLMQIAQAVLRRVGEVENFGRAGQVPPGSRTVQ